MNLPTQIDAMWNSHGEEAMKEYADILDTYFQQHKIIVNQKAAKMILRAFHAGFVHGASIGQKSGRRNLIQELISEN
jgi:hypothetical protein